MMLEENLCHLKREKSERGMTLGKAGLHILPKGVEVIDLN